MGKHLKLVFLFSLLIVLSTTFSVVASSNNPPKEIQSIHIKKSASYAGGEDEQQLGATSSNSKTSLTPISNSSSISPGVVIGNTWYDYQHNGTMGRMIDYGFNDPSYTTSSVYFGWMRLPGAALAERHYAYNYYNAESGILNTQKAVQPLDEYGGYVNVQAKNNGEFFISGHNDAGDGFQTEIYSPPIGYFGFITSTRIPDTTASYAGYPVQSLNWPKFAYQEGTDTVIHIIAQISTPSGEPQAIYYFRRVGPAPLGIDQGTWDYPPYVIDTIYTLCQDIVASRTSDKVALVWNANLNYTGDSQYEQYPPGVCDTCSGTSPIHVQYDNDVYYQTSDDQGVTWNPRVNVTKNRLGEAGYRAYTDLSSLIDSDGDLHILYTAIPWAADYNEIEISDASRLFHYSEDMPFVRTVHSAEWYAPNCGPGAWNLNISKMSISECDGKFYALWTQFNDLPNGIDDDCAAWSSTHYSGSANGELFMSVSSDNGVTWDVPRNLTNSYTPDCDPTIGYDCESDHWASMALFGHQTLPGEDWSGAVTVDPSGSYASDYYLDIQYVNDRDAGGIIQNEGSWQLSNLNWFRMACVEPVPNPKIIFSPDNIDLPTWVKPGGTLDLDLTIENFGNVALSYTPIVEEDDGPTGWLAVSGLSGSIPSGLSNYEVGTLHLNNGGIQTVEAGLHGRVIFISNAASSPDTIEVYLVVYDTLFASEIDTVSGYLSLAVASNGNFGNMGMGRVNMDFVTNGVDCDTTADVYLFDGSPLIGKIDGADTVFYHSYRQDNIFNSSSFTPLGGQEKSSEFGYNRYSSGTFVTPDTSIALQQTFYAPTEVGASYMIKELKIWSADGSAHNGLRIGDVIDWDIPSDTGAWNEAGMTYQAKTLFQVGGEYHQDDTGVNASCSDSDARFGGVAYMKTFLNNSIINDEYPYSAYTARTDSFILATGNLVPSELWNNMEPTGLTVETDVEDQHTVMCYEPSYDLGESDTLVIFTTLMTIANGNANDLPTLRIEALDFAADNSYWMSCCKGIRGNVDGSMSESMDIADLVYLVSYMFGGGPPPPCLEEADCNGDGQLDISDLICFVGFMFNNGFAPNDCF